MKKIIASALFVCTAFAAEPAWAVLPVCSASDISSTPSPVNTPFASTTCQGFFSGNLLSNNPGDKTAQVNALNTLLGSTVYSTATFNFGDFTTLSGLSGLKTIDFAGTLSGMTLIGVHYGNGVGSPGNTVDGDATAFYLFNAGTNLDKFYLTYNSSSNVTLYSTGGRVPDPTAVVPEPATWAMMMFGFALVGAAMRRRPAKQTLRVTYG